MEKLNFNVGVTGNKEGENKNKDILNSIEFYDSNLVYVEKIKKELEKLDLSGLEGMAVIDLENNMDGKNLIGYPGIEQAQQLLLKDSKRKLLLLDISNVEEIAKYKPEIRDLLKKDNVKFANMLGLDFKTIPDIMNK